MSRAIGTPISPDLGPEGRSDWEILQEALEEMDPDLVWIEGHGWVAPEDAE